MDRIKLRSRVLHAEEEAFEPLALDIFRYQAAQNPLYRQYLDALRKTPRSIGAIEEIPFMPIGFFKYHKVLCKGIEAKVTFQSSGTTGAIRSSHYLADTELYKQVALKTFQKYYGSISEYCILALLPSYLEREGSSLVFMVDHFIKKAAPGSGFFLHDTKNLLHQIKSAQESGRKVLLLGVTFALMDLAEKEPLDFRGVTIMETGGMKGRRKELTRDEVHQMLIRSFKVDTIHSEYGMTELLSQAYSGGHGIFSMPPTMKVLFREANDPFSVGSVSNGGINIIDLANLDSCSFIETSDLGSTVSEGRFKVSGRFDNSDVRGCNLLMEV